MFGFNLKDYDLKAELSICCNQICVVYLAHHKPSNDYVSLKKYRMDKAKEESALIKDEIIIMRQFNHPNILPFHTAFVENFDLYVIAPIMCYGSCRDTINHTFRTGFPEVMICLILKDVLHGLEYLHKKGYIHRSIRGSHILLNQTNAVICGFRESTSLLTHGERVKTLFNLPRNNAKGLNWLAPEVLEQNLLGYTEKSDVYSIGITSCELANGIEPFSDMPTTFMLTEKIRGNQPSLLDNSTCPTEDMIVKVPNDNTSMSGAGAAGGSSSGGGGAAGGDSLAIQTQQIYSQKKFTDSFHKFTELCLQRFPESRPNTNYLLNHTFFKQTKHTSLHEQFCLHGMQIIDFEKIKDENVNLSCDFGEMSLSGNFEWDF